MLNNTLYFDSPDDDLSRRESLYAGQIFVFSPTAATRALCAHARTMIEEAFAGSDIETNPPATNDAVEKSGLTFSRQVEILPQQSVLAEIDEKVDFSHMEKTLMDEGIKKFADPQKALIKLIGELRSKLS